MKFPNIRAPNDLPHNNVIMSFSNTFLTDSLFIAASSVTK